MVNNVENIINLEVDMDEVGTRLDLFVSNLVPELSRSRVQQLIKENELVLVNNKTGKNSYKLKYGDRILVKIPKAEPLELKAENIPLDICYEDPDMLVINKPSGMLTHPTSIEREHTLVNALLHHCKGNLSGINGVMRPGILHRLDRDTSGLLMIAKNDYAHQFLSNQVQEKSAIRKYLTIVHGVLKEDSGTIIAPIDRHPTKRHKMAVVEGGKHSVTHWKVLERFKKFTFIEVKLETGRTHQIRVHFSYNNHPVVGDPLYGGENIKVKLNGQALQAYNLEFTSPYDKKPKNIVIDTENGIMKLLRFLQVELKEK